MRVPHLILAALSLLLAAALAACASSSSGDTAPQGGASAPSLGKRTRFHDCHARGPLPDSACTPGAIFADATASRICVPGYSRRVRHVSSSTKRRAYTEYGIRSHRRGQYEVDHLVSLELGGSNSIANLWPEPALPRPGFHEKDQVEDYLHQQVCDGNMSLRRAQREIASNWLAVYRTMNR